jgi:hypothetical protein
MPNRVNDFFNTAIKHYVFVDLESVDVSKAELLNNPYENLKSKIKLNVDEPTFVLYSKHLMKFSDEVKQKINLTDNMYYYPIANKTGHEVVDKAIVQDVMTTCARANRSCRLQKPMIVLFANDADFYELMNNVGYAGLPSMFVTNNPCNENLWQQENRFEYQYVDLSISLERVTNKPESPKISLAGNCTSEFNSEFSTNILIDKNIALKDDDTMLNYRDTVEEIKSRSEKGLLLNEIVELIDERSSRNDLMVSAKIEDIIDVHYRYMNRKLGETLLPVVNLDHKLNGVSLESWRDIFEEHLRGVAGETNYLYGPGKNVTVYSYSQLGTAITSVAKYPSGKAARRNFRHEIQRGLLYSGMLTSVLRAKHKNVMGQYNKCCIVNWKVEAALATEFSFFLTPLGI